MMTRPRVVRDDGIAWGEPRLERTGTPVGAIAERFMAGDSIYELRRDFRLDGAEVEEALRYGLYTRRQVEKYLAGLDPCRRADSRQVPR